MPFIHPERRMNSGGALRAFDDELPFIYTSGIRAIVSLLNLPSDASVYESAGFAHLCIPIPDGCAPTIEEAFQFVRFVDDQLGRKQAVAVHCEGGIGRTGTMLAAYFIAHGKSARESIVRVRASEPSAVETTRQIQFLEDFQQSVAKHSS